MQSNVTSLSFPSTSNTLVRAENKTAVSTPVELDISVLEHVAGGKAATGTLSAISTPALTTPSIPRGGW